MYCNTSILAKFSIDSEFLSFFEFKILGQTYICSDVIYILKTFLFNLHFFRLMLLFPYVINVYHLHAYYNEYVGVRRNIMYIICYYNLFNVPLDCTWGFTWTNTGYEKDLIYDLHIYALRWRTSSATIRCQMCSEHMVPLNGYKYINATTLHDNHLNEKKNKKKSYFSKIKIQNTIAVYCTNRLQVL